MMNSPSDKPLSPKRVRLGAISFINTMPIYADYQPSADEVELVYEVPARLNAMIRSGELDISPVSSACYLREKDKLVLLEDLSVSSPGAVESVIFLSKTPLGPEMLDVSTIYVPNDSETSVMLLAHLLKEATGQDFRSWFQVYEATEYQTKLQNADNALVIGDNALIIQESLRVGTLEGFYCYDLSTLWKERTGLPFVFAVWVANRQWAEQNPDALASVNQQLCDARNRFYADASVFESGMGLARLRSSLPDDTLERYYRQCLTYTLTDEHRASLERFEAILQAADSSSAKWESSVLEHQPSR